MLFKQLKILPFYFIFTLFIINKMYATDTYYNFQCPDGSNPTGTSTTSSYTNGSFGTGTFNRVIGGYNFNNAWYQTGDYYPNPKLHSTSPAQSTDENNLIVFSTVEIYRYFNTPSMEFRAYWTAKVYTCPVGCENGKIFKDGICQYPDNESSTGVCQKDIVQNLTGIYNCNANTGELTLIDNATDLNKGNVTCADGFTVNTLPVLNVGGDPSLLDYTETICVPDNATPTDEVKEIIEQQPTDENTTANDSLLTNKLLQGIKDNSILTREKIVDTNSLLTNTNSKLDSLKSSIDGLDSTISTGLDSANSSLENIDNTLIDIKDLQIEGNDIQNNILNRLPSPDSRYDSTEFDDNIGDSLNIFDSVLSEFTTFKENIFGQYENIIDFGNSSKDLIDNGFTNIFSSNTSTITTCQKSFTFDYVKGSIQFDVDPCYVTSMLRPILYPLFYIVFSIALFSLSINLFKGVI